MHKLPHFDQKKSLNAGIGALWWWPFVLPFLSLKAYLVFVMKNNFKLEKCLDYRFFMKFLPSTYTWKFELMVNKRLPKRCPSGLLVVIYLHISNKCINIFQSFFCVFSVLFSNFFTACITYSMHHSTCWINNNNQANQCSYWLEIYILGGEIGNKQDKWM